jgi:hypothetical protein
MLAKSQYQRVERVILFAAELAGTMRKEFEPVWRTPGPIAEAAEALIGRLEVLERKVERAETALSGVNLKFPQEAMRALTGIDLNDMTASAKGLEGLAARLREVVAAHSVRPAEAPVGTEPQGKGLLGFLRKIAADPTIVEGTARPAPPRPVDPAIDKAKQAFEGVMQLVTEVLEYVSPRLHMVKVPLEVIGLPGPKKPWDDVKAKLLPTGQAQGLPPASLKWLPHLAKLFYEDMGAVQKGHMAVVQWVEAQSLFGDAQLLQSALSSAPPDRVKRLLDSFNVGKLRAAIFPLSHLHISFRGVKHLETIFPPPSA